MAVVRTSTTVAHLVRAALDGVVCSLLDGADALADGTARAPGPGRRPITVVGGGARSLAFRQAIADLAQAPVMWPGTAEWVAQGAAAQAAGVLAGIQPAQVASMWAMEPVHVAEPAVSADGAAAIRARHAALRSRTGHEGPPAPGA